jgi:hypothetical protein
MRRRCPAKLRSRHNDAVFLTLHGCEHFLILQRADALHDRKPDALIRELTENKRTELVIKYERGGDALGGR